MIPEPTITKIHATPDFCKREVVPFNNYATALDDLGYVRGRRALAGLWGVEVQTLAPEGEWLSYLHNLKILQVVLPICEAAQITNF